MEQRLQQLKHLVSKLPHAKLGWAITLLAVVYIAFLAAKLFWLIWPTPVNSSLSPSYINSVTGKPERVNTQLILAQNLFGKADAVPKKQASQQAQVINNAPETRLSINLTGIVAVSGNDQTGLAIIESQGQQSTYLVDDVVQGTRAKLAQVLPDRVILDVSGRFETLMLDGVDFTKTVSMPVLAERDSDEPELDDGPQMESDRQIDVTANQEVKEALIDTREELLKDPGKLFDYIRVSQAMKDGELIGYRLSPGKDPALFTQMGLQNNDLAVSINGYQLTDLKQAMSAINELRNSTDANITIDRDGEQIDVQFSLQ
ncbi:MAG: general secretion pathway protein C [Pseudoalteromonas rhizosphaerae]|jgi:general secretion pathway protein C|uniref:Type II secretion system protein GspC n=1 Tax=Pseudoalteromonas neustonica TaxID=1840331 RepID=A0ABY3F7W3_9GAMM|nr:MULTISPECIES: type II secretion system protein GspC [Pseudoalteromonas]MBB1295418.1 type II secretion system protein GspC [Pseudoalteromonas sp. SR41-4]MBB1303616.1 type II secretion system protein GspC [Pseudoalteromonas sp. SR44-8]MBB1399882.1 type II secretion system protein GspC [Pseudoalteromonas sp. SG44-8]MBB1507658.1 type II secretion system protein GspC [Pseudoalteromonas sp. SG41-1]TVU79775.1 type II secretion system protein GspC [Pseudoalteromonas neustonica]